MNRKKQPLVSIIMPIYNSEAFLREAIDSILSQTYQNIELFLVNDASTDNSLHIIREYEAAFSPFVKVIHLKKHKGDSYACNIALKKARGEFIARMDSDDISTSARIKKQVDFLTTHPKVIVLGTQARVINVKNETIGQRHVPLSHGKIYKTFGLFNAMIHPSCMIRRSLLPRKNHLYSDIYGASDEYFTFFHLFQYGEFANLAEQLICYRIHGKNISIQNPKKLFWISLIIRKRAYRELNYQLSFSTLCLIFFQVIFVSLLPTFLIVPFYMLLRGTFSHREIVIKILSNLSPTAPTFSLKG